MAALSEDIVNGRHITDGFNAQMNRGMTLRIEIQQQHAFSARRESRRNVDAGGRLPNAALLIHDTNRAHRSPFQKNGATLGLTWRRRAVWLVG